MSVVKRERVEFLLGSFACVSVFTSTVSINFNRRRSAAAFVWVRVHRNGFTT